MNWNYRVVDITDENGGDELYAIEEVFYDDDDKPMGHTEASVISETTDGLKWVLEQMADALNHPVLKPEDFKKGN